MSSSHFTNNLFSTPVSSSLIKVSLDEFMSTGIEPWTQTPLACDSESVRVEGAGDGDNKQ